MFFELVKNYNLKRELPYLATVGLGLLILYFITMPTGVTLEDSGLFLTAARSLGTVHPPGYPLYILLAHAFSWLVPNNPALGVHLLSALCGSLACVLLYCCVLCLGGRRLGALVAAFSYGFSSTFWWQSIVAEVYSLHAMLFFILLFLLIKMSDPNSFSEKSFYSFSFVLGLSLANHWPLLFLCLPAFFLLLMDIFQRKGSKKGKRKKKQNHPVLVPKALFYFGLGLLPYLYIVISSYYEPAASFTKIESFSDFWGYISRAAYSKYDSSTGGDLFEKWKYISFFFTQLIEEFYWPGFVLILGGFIFSWKGNHKGLGLTLLLCFLSSSVLLHLFMHRKFSLNGKEIFQVYLLIPFGIAALYIGLAFCHKAIYEKLGPRLVCLLVFPALLALGSTFFANYKQNNMRRENFAQSIANSILKSLPSHANIFIDNDVYTGPLMYLNLVADVRQDITLYNQHGRLLGNRIVYAKDTSLKEALNQLYDFIAANQPFYALVSSRGELLRALEQDPRLKVSNQGIVYQYMPKSSQDEESSYVRTVFADEIRQFLSELDMGLHPGKRWHSMRGGVIEHFCSLLSQEQKGQSAASAHPYCIQWYTNKRKSVL